MGGRSDLFQAMCVGGPTSPPKVGGGRSGGKGGGGGGGRGGGGSSCGCGGRLPVLAPAQSRIWKSFKPYRGQTRTNGKTGNSARYFQWDYTHGNIEVYNKSRVHIGVMSPTTGKMIGPPVKGRKGKW
ncbi:colicin E3/pyocin S6 family cytotoxin [Calidifontibacter terrae]